VSKENQTYNPSRLQLTVMGYTGEEPGKRSPGHYIAWVKEGHWPNAVSDCDVPNSKKGLVALLPSCNGA